MDSPQFNRKKTLWFVVAVCFSFSTVGHCRATDVPSLKPILMLIEDLGNKRFAIRQEAVKQLLSHGMVAAPELLKTLDQTADVDLQTQINQILDQMLNPTAKLTPAEKLKRLKQYANGNKIDLLTEAMVLWRTESGDNWNVPFAEATNHLKELAKKHRDTKFRIPRYPEDWLRGPLVKLSRPGYCVVADKIQGEGCHSNFAISTNFEIVESTVWGSFVFGSGKINSMSIQDSVIFIRGPIDLKTPGIAAPGGISDSLVFCDGDIIASSITDSVVIASGRIEYGLVSSNNHALIAQDDKILRSLTWMNLARLGAEVISEQKGLRVKKLSNESFLFAGGLREGDLIVRANRSHCTSVSKLVSLVSRAKIADQPIVIVFDRNGMIEYRLVALPE